jgi:predicted PurR-regulated permease PerM
MRRDFTTAKNHIMQIKYPFYFKATVILLGLTLLVFALTGLREILTPICFALVLAILLNKPVGRLQRLKLSRTTAIFIAMFIAFSIILALGYFISSRLLIFGNDLPVLKVRFAELISQFQQWADSSMGITMNQQNQWLAQIEAGLKPLIAQTLGNVIDSLSILFLLPVYTFLILYYKDLILNFLYEVFAEANAEKVGEVLFETKTAIQRYMIGLILEGLVVAVLNITALSLLGVKYAVVLGLIGALLNVLPYIGGIIAILLPVIVATITSDGIYTQLEIVAAYLFIQFLDNNFLIPMLVSSRVQINALLSIIVVLLGGALWGVAGMFLAVPFTGVLKIIFDRIDELKPWGKLLGSEIPTIKKLQIGSKKK